jgi:hypothetical protein
VDLLWPCIAADGEGSAIGGRQSYGDHLVSGQLAAQGFLESVDSLIQEGALNTDQQVVGQHTQKDVSLTRRSKWWKMGRSHRGLFIARKAASTRLSST